MSSSEIVRLAQEQLKRLDDLPFEERERAEARIAAQMRTAFASRSDDESEGATDPGRIVEAIPATLIKPEPTEYVWAGRIVQSELGLIVGPPGVGKGSIMMDLIAQLTRGTLVGDLYGTPSSALIASAEDSPSRTLIPRLLAAGADLELVQIVRVKDKGDEDALTLPDDVPSLSALVELSGAALVLIDPISAHLASSVDSHRDASIRRALAPLARMSHETGAALMVVAHTNKAT